MIHIYEAVCPKCGETFNPAGPEDLTHIAVEGSEGTDCGTADHYWEHHTEGYSIEVHTSPTELQEALVERISHPERRHPLIKFCPLPATPKESREINEHFDRMAAIDRDSQVREIMELLRPSWD